jgi:hypothetical protein
MHTARCCHVLSGIQHHDQEPPAACQTGTATKGAHSAVSTMDGLMRRERHQRIRWRSSQEGSHRRLDAVSTLAEHEDNVLITPEQSECVCATVSHAAA